MAEHEHNVDTFAADKGVTVNCDQIEEIFASCLRDDDTINFKIRLKCKRSGKSNKRKGFGETVSINSSDVHSSLLRSNIFKYFYKDFDKKCDSFNKYLQRIKDSDGDDGESDIEAEKGSSKDAEDEQDFDIPNICEKEQQKHPKKSKNSHSNSNSSSNTNKINKNNKKKKNDYKQTWVSLIIHYEVTLNGVLLPGNFDGKFPPSHQKRLPIKLLFQQLNDRVLFGEVTFHFLYKCKYYTMYIILIGCCYVYQCRIG